ncbi:hypothetical protein T12_14693 [Trichinella patagoniensis]|uniref:Uncharacterized protein n=1 Tax=Trichinella patagoniensis TaxID=990121 RepID=A0A0V0ZVT4_9BILA|nr:hypothetical protein T12_14693 [Trichinella patagoniensis]
MQQVSTGKKSEGTGRVEKTWLEFQDSDEDPDSEIGALGLKSTVKAPGFAPRLRPRANKNLHIPSGYAPGNL